MAVPQTEAWQRGPVPGFDPLLMPIVHALIQAREDLERLAARVPPEHVWQRPGGAASIGFHVRHSGGALDRLFTYARGEGLSDAQRAFAKNEGEPGEPVATMESLVAEVGRLIGQLRQGGTSVLLVEQSAAFAVQVSDYTYVMSQGAIVHASAPEALWKNEEIKTQYLGVPGRSG